MSTSRPLTSSEEKKMYLFLSRANITTRLYNIEDAILTFADDQSQFNFNCWESIYLRAEKAMHHSITLGAILIADNNPYNPNRNKYIYKNNDPLLFQFHLNNYQESLKKYKQFLDEARSKIKKEPDHSAITKAQDTSSQVVPTPLLPRVNWKERKFELSVDLKLCKKPQRIEFTTPKEPPPPLTQPAAPKIKIESAPAAIQTSNTPLQNKLIPIPEFPVEAESPLAGDSCGEETQPLLKKSKPWIRLFRLPSRSAAREKSGDCPAILNKFSSAAR